MDQMKNTKSNFIKFILILSVLLAYGFIVSMQYGIKDGIYISILTWSFFVLCTPIADAGFLLDFPIRLIANIKMLHTELAVWLIAILVNLYTFNFQHEIYQNTLMLKLFENILSQPYPYWSVILISALGTFISIHFGDEVVDKLEEQIHAKVHSHTNKYQYILMIFAIVMALIIYHSLLKDLGIDIPL